MTHLWLTRHGQTDWNVAGRYQGQSDAPLNATGRAQAQALAEALGGQTFAAVYASDLARAYETAHLIAATIPLPVQTDVRLREIHQGEWEGQLVADIRARYAELWAQRLTDPTQVRPPGGETVAEVAARIYAALDDIAARHPSAPILVVSHGLALATVICRTFNISLGQVYHVIPNNAEVVKVTWSNLKPLSVTNL